MNEFLNNIDVSSLPKFDAEKAKAYAALVDENRRMKRLLSSMAQLYHECVIENDVMSLQEADEMYENAEGWYVDTVLWYVLDGAVGESIAKSKPQFKISDCKEAYIILHGQPKRDSHLNIVK